MRAPAPRRRTAAKVGAYQFFPKGQDWIAVPTYEFPNYRIFCRAAAFSLSRIPTPLTDLGKPFSAMEPTKEESHRRKSGFSTFADNLGIRGPCHRDPSALGIRIGNPGIHNRSSGGHFPSSRARPTLPCPTSGLQALSPWRRHSCLRPRLRDQAGIAGPLQIS